MPITGRNRGAATAHRTDDQTRTLVWDILNGAEKSDMQVIDAVRKGLPALALDDLMRAGLAVSEIAHVVGISARTLQRTRGRGASGALGVAQSDRIIRLARIVADADRYIGDHEKALCWLRTQNWALGNRVPLGLLAAEPGVEMVRQSLINIAYGGTA